MGDLRRFNDTTYNFTVLTYRFSLSAYRKMEKEKFREVIWEFIYNKSVVNILTRRYNESFSRYDEYDFYGIPYGEETTSR